MTYNFDDLKGRNCVITGGFGVIGLALTKGLAAAGVNLAVISRKAAESPMAAEIRQIDTNPTNNINNDDLQDLK